MDSNWINVASGLKEIIKFCLDEEITSKRKTVKERIMDRIYRNKMMKFCNKYVKRHDGTILTSSSFIGIVQERGVLERLFKCTENIHTTQSDPKIINDVVLEIEKNLDKPLSVIDKFVLKDFFTEILRRHRVYREKCLSSESKQVIQAIGRGNEKTKETIETVGEEIITNIKNMQGPLSHNDVISFFLELDKHFWNGDFSLLEAVFPLLQGKNDDLRIWLSILLQRALLSGEVYQIDKSVNEICLPVIRNDAKRKVIIFSYLNQDTSVLMELEADGELGDLITKLVEGDTWLFEEIKETKSNVECTCLKPFTGLQSEKETIARLQIINLFNRGLLGISDIMKSILADTEIDFLVNLLLTDRVYSEKLYKCEDEYEAREVSNEVFQKLWKDQEIYSMMIKKLQIIYWRAVLNASKFAPLNLSAEIISSIPKKIRNEVQDHIVITNIANKTATDTEILDVWHKFQNVRVLMEYLFSKPYTEAIEFIETHFPNIIDYPEIFINYIELLRHNNGQDKAITLLKQAEVQFADYAEFWLEIVTISGSEEYVNRLEEHINSNNLKYLHLQTEELIARLLFDRKRFTTCLKVIESITIKGISHKELKKLKAFALINSEKMVEGLTLLNEIACYYNSDEYIIKNIILCSLELHRDIAEDIVEAAKNIGTAEMLFYVAVVYEKKGKIDISKQYFWKAILLNQDCKSKVYGNYWIFSTKYTSDEMIIKASDDGTCITAEHDDGNRIVIGVIGKEYLNQELQFLEENMLVSLDVAIKNGWIHKKVGENISYKEVSYKIIELISMESFFTRFSMEKMLSNDGVKVFSMPINASPDDVRKSFVDFLKQNHFGDNQASKVIDEYKDFSQMPIPLNKIAKMLGTNYIVTVASILEDKNIIVREEVNYDKPLETDNKGYVLSFSALILLFKLGLPASLLADNNVIIPNSVLFELMDEKKLVISENKGDNFGKIALIEDELQVFKASEESKNQLMTYAIDLLKYTESIPHIENQQGANASQMPESQLRDIFGTFDIDALSICHQFGYKLISFELFLSGLSSFSEIDVSVCNILEFLNYTVSDDIELIGYLKKIAGFRMMNILDEAILSRIATCEEDEIVASWIDYMEFLEKTEDEYREWLRESLSNIYKRHVEKSSTLTQYNRNEHAFLALLMNLCSFEPRTEVSQGIDENGDIIIRTRCQLFNTKTKKCIEGSEQVFDHKIKIIDNLVNQPPIE